MNSLQKTTKRHKKIKTLGMHKLFQLLQQHMSTQDFLIVYTKMKVLKPNLYTYLLYFLAIQFNKLHQIFFTIINWNT